jgi:hypothetical protein
LSSESFYPSTATLAAMKALSTVARVTPFPSMILHFSQKLPKSIPRDVWERALGYKTREYFFDFHKVSFEIFFDPFPIIFILDESGDLPPFDIIIEHSVKHLRGVFFPIFKDRVFFFKDSCLYFCFVDLLINRNVFFSECDYAFVHVFPFFLILYIVNMLAWVAESCKYKDFLHVSSRHLWRIQD